MCLRRAWFVLRRALYLRVVKIGLVVFVFVVVVVEVYVLEQVSDLVRLRSPTVLTPPSPPVPSCQPGLISTKKNHMAHRREADPRLNEGTYLRRNYLDSIPIQTRENIS